MKAPPPTDDNARYSIFFSHKVNDEPVTNALIDLLDTHTEHIRYFVSENIEKGKEWRKSIAKELTRSSFLVLVFTDPNEDWGWCLYETGFFDALSQNLESTRRIYCLHNALTPPPPPIADLQTVPAKSEDVRQWLTELFKHTQQTKEAFAKAIPQLAEEICTLFSDRQKPVYLTQFVDITIDQRLLSSPDDLPDSATVDGDEKTMNELFGRGKSDWRSVKERFYRFPNSVVANISTLKEIARAAYGIYNHNIVLPIQGIIFVGQGPKRYRPVISYAKQLAGGRIRCRLLLIEDVGGQLQNVDRPLGALLTGIRMAVRVRWEVVRPFASRISRLSRLDVRKLRFDLQTCLNNVFLEAEFRGYFSPEDVFSAFDSETEKATLLAIIEEFELTYPKIWEGIGFLNMTETFGEVSGQPMTDQDLFLLESGLQNLETLNRRFLSMAVARAEVLIQRELSNNISPQKDLRGSRIRRNREPARAASQTTTKPESPPRRKRKSSPARPKRRPQVSA